MLERFGWQPHADPATMGTTWRAIYRFQHTLFAQVVLQRATDTFMHVRLNGIPSIPAGMGFAPIYAQ